MTEYDAVVYDLDGTLVCLDVDWGAAAVEAAEVLAARGIDTGGMDLWDMLERADEEGYRGSLESVLTDHERAGARTADPLPLAEDLPLPVPVGVCSLNCEAACHIALETHGLDGHVDVVVGRDTVDTYKPDPEPLLAAARGLGAEPDETLFVGDSESDAEAARRAGVAFQHVRERH
ncbi:MAG: phosphoglycolate phosphatase [Halobacteriales archaeon SW_9_67_25]|nr:MAG: phosphoglycolate phosphatase [Halobacteriales archaeon SW_9_67_25]